MTPTARKAKKSTAVLQPAGWYAISWSSRESGTSSRQVSNHVSKRRSTSSSATAPGQSRPMSLRDGQMRAWVSSIGPGDETCDEELSPKKRARLTGNECQDGDDERRRPSSRPSAGRLGGQSGGVSPSCPVRGAR